MCPKSFIEHNTIMPDGRPFYTWEAELGMLRQELDAIEPFKKRLVDLARTLRVISISTEKDLCTHDLIIKVNRTKVISSDPAEFNLYPEKFCEVEKFPKKEVNTNEKSKQSTG